QIHADRSGEGQVIQKQDGRAVSVGVRAVACAQHEPAVLAAVHPLERRQLDKVAEQRAGVGTVDVGDSSIPSGVRIEGIEDVIAIWVCPELSDPEGFLANLMEIDSAA